MSLQELIEQVLRESGKPESAADVKEKLENSGVDLKAYVDPRSSVLATIQQTLEQIPKNDLQRLVSPGGETRFQWVYRSNPAPTSLASTLARTNS
jgi:hypothetical protein